MEKHISEKGIATGELEKHLNKRLKDVSFRKELFSNPIEVLKREGLTLDKEKESSIAEYMKELTFPPKAIELGNMTVDSKAAGIGIGISIPFDVADATDRPVDL